MEMVNEKIVLNNYLELMKLNKISFLGNNLYLKGKIENEIINIRNENNMHEKIQIAKKLWKLLFEAAMTFIDPDKDGYDRLFEYFDEYVNFEELIFASDSFYRDHTLHCLWVYFLGEYINCNYNIMTGLYKEFKIFNSELKKCNMNDVFGDYIKKCDRIFEPEKYADSIRCISALTHDLGYPLKKINKVNNCIKKILPYFGINDYAEFNFSYSDIQQNYINSFLEIMNKPIGFLTRDENSLEERELMNRIFGADKDKNLAIGKVNINMEELKKVNNREKAILKELFRVYFWVAKSTNEALKLSKDLEEYQHGIMSAFLLMRTLRAFQKMSLKYRDNGDMEEWSFNYGDYMTKWNILYAITCHTSSGYKIQQIVNETPFLLIIDELEEFSRMSRANKNRQYVNEFCKTQICTKDNYFQVDFIFDNSDIDNLDPERAFKDKCKRFLSIFDIPNLDEKLRIRIRFIDKFKDDEKIYKLEISRKYADITIDGIEQDIPRYLRSNQFYAKEGYMSL